MTDPIASVVRVAATPEQAKIFVAMLQAEGIPATVEGDSLADEFAMSRRLMNLGGTRVMVPTSSLARAREILDVGDVDAADLEAQALAADPLVAAAAAARPVPPPRPVPWFLLCACGAAVVFLGLWLSEVDARASERNPKRRYEPLRDGMREVRRSDGAVLGDYFDEDRDGCFERVVQYSLDGSQVISVDADADLRYERITERRGNLLFVWVDEDRDGLADVCTVADADGKVLQELRFAAGQGFVLRQR